MNHRERAAPGVYCTKHVGAKVMFCVDCKTVWSPCCGESSPHPVDRNLVKHLREQIARDPTGYANSAKLKAAVAGLDADLTGGSRDASIGPPVEGV